MAQGRRWGGGIGLETRIALAACVVMGSTLCGKAVADASRRRLKTLCALAEGLRTLKIHMTGLYEPVRNALSRSDCPLLECVAEVMGSGESAEEAWRRIRKRALRRGGPADALMERDLAVLEGLFARLGQSGREEQENLLSGTIREIERLRDEARAKAREADRLYLGLGLLIGLMLALIVL